jgi:starch phosphorylase
MTPIRTDEARRVARLERGLHPGLRKLAPLAYNYAWSWHGGDDVFARIDPTAWRAAGENPVRFLASLPDDRQEAATADPAVTEAIDRLAGAVADRLEEPPPGEPPVAFFCAEYGVHRSLPVYSGGLGVLAGDILKEASDQRLSFVAVGLFYRRGYFRQRVDRSGWQQESWPEQGPGELPVALVEDADGSPLSGSVELFGRPVAYRVWRVQVGLVPLLLLDADLPENDIVARWTTARLYDANPEVRLAQYGLLGLGGGRTLQALGIDPAVIHLNEGHPALAPLALAGARERVVFTTHTPVAAGNETYPEDVFARAFGGAAERLGIGRDGLLAMAASQDGHPGMSALAMRLSRRRNAVSRLHGQTANAIWAPLLPELRIDHVTNGAHLATFIADPLRELFDRHLGDGWRTTPDDASAWAAVSDIPNAELWAARCEARAAMIDYTRRKAAADRLLRSEGLRDVEAAAAFDPEALTLGFARRVASYKRLDVLFADPGRLAGILHGERACQLLVAGKAHPDDAEGKHVLQRVLGSRAAVDGAGDRFAFLDDYNLSLGRELVRGCDVWINLPRPPLEASGTSGMKAAFNGALQLSVLDGWWAEAYDGENGWAIDARTEGHVADADATDAERLYTLLEREVVPMFYERDAAGVPNRWCELVKRSLATCAPRFTATRMLKDYRARMYAG